MDLIYDTVLKEESHDSNVVQNELYKKKSQHPHKESLYEILYSKYRLTTSETQK